MAIYSLDSLREDIEKKFAPVTLELADGSEVVLQNMLRLPAGVRKQVLELLRGIRRDDDEQEIDPGFILESTQKVIELVAKDKKGRKLVAQIGDDLALTTKIIELWTEATQPGEAQNSHD
jgi:hypothetical protein